MANTRDIKVYMDIGSLSSPNNGGGYVDVTDYCAFNGLEINEQRTNEQYFKRLSYAGEVAYWGLLFDVITGFVGQDEYRTGIRLIDNGTQLGADGYIDIRGSQDFNRKRGVGKITARDAYRALFEGLSKNQNILQYTPIVSNTFRKDTSFVEFVRYPAYPIPQQQSAFDCSSLLGAVQAEILPDPSVLDDTDYSKAYRQVVTQIACAGIGPVYARLVNVLVVNITEKKLVPKLAGEDAPPSAEWKRIPDYLEGFLGESDVVIDGVEYTAFIRYPTELGSTYQYNDTGGSSPSNQETTITLDISGYSNDVTYTRQRILKEVLKSMVNFVDSSIAFEDNDTPASTDSFYYLKTYEKDGGYPLKHMTISQITDTILTDSGLEKEIPATIGLLSLEDLFRFLWQRFKITWYLENRSGTYYFVLKHLSEFVYTPGTDPQYNLTDYKGENWSVKKNQVTYDVSQKYIRVQRTTTANNVDHLGTDIIIPDLESLFDNVLQFTEEKFLTDIWDIIENKDRYSDSNNSQFVVFSNDLQLGSQLAEDAVSSVGYDNFQNFPGTTVRFTADVSNASQNCYVNINDFSGYGALSEIRIAFTMDKTSGTMPEMQVLEDVGGLDVITTYPVSSGGNEIIHVLNSGMGSDKDVYVRFKTGVGDSSDYEVSYLSIKAYEYSCRIVDGELSGTPVANNDLSIANCDVDHFLRNMPARRANVNGVLLTLDDDQLQYDEGYESFAPIYFTGMLDDDKSVTTDQGQLIPYKITISTMGRFARINWRKVI